MIRRLLTAFCYSLMIVSFSVAALPAVVLNFDDLSTYQFLSMPSEYGGLSWDDRAYTDDGYWRVMQYSGSLNARSTPFYLANGNFAESLWFSSSEPMNSVGAWFSDNGTDADEEDIRLRMIGYVDETPTYYSDWLQLSSTPAFLTFNTALSGVRYVVVEAPGVSFRMDDLAINEGDFSQATPNPVAEPASMLLLGIGIAGFGIRSMKKGRKA